MMRWLLLFVILMLARAEQMYAMSPKSLTSGVSMYLPLEDTNPLAHPRYTNGSSAVETVGDLSATPGVAGGAMWFPPGASLQLGCPCNVALTQATLSVWVRTPSLMGGSRRQQTVFRFMGTELMIATTENTTTVHFVTQGRSHDGNLELEFDTLASTVGASSASKWHHIAVAWNESGWKMLRVDAGPPAVKQTEVVPALTDPIASPSSSFVMGTAEPYNINTEPLELDEIVAWNRVLSFADLSFCTKQPGDVSTMLNEELPSTASSKRLVSFELFRPATAKGSLDPTGSVIAPGQRFNATVPIHVWGSKVHLEMTAVLRGFSNVTNSVVQHNWSTTILPPNSSTWVQLSVLAPAQRGPYSIDLRCVLHEIGSSEATALPATSVASFASWPVRHRTSGCTPAELFFGSHIPPDACHHATAGCEPDGFEPGAFLQQALRLGYCGPLRDHDMLQATKMNYVEPRPDQWGFIGHDGMQRIASALYPVLGNVAQTPEWAANLSGIRPDGHNVSTPCSGANHCHPPNQDAFAEYFRRTILRYQAIVSMYEFWNEPVTTAFWGGSIEQYALIAKTARSVIEAVVKAGGPRVQLLIGGFVAYGEDSFQDQLGKAGALAHADGLSFHMAPEVCLSFGCAGKFDDMEHFATLLAKRTAFFRNLSRQHIPKFNKSSVEVPLWSTEGGTEDTSFLIGLSESGAGLPPSRCLPPLTFRDGAARTVVGEALMQVSGVKAHYYYWQAQPPPHGWAAQSEGSAIEGFANTNMLDLTLAPRPKLLARLAFQERIALCSLPPTLVRQEAAWCFVYDTCQNDSAMASRGMMLLWSEQSVAVMLATIEPRLRKVTGRWDIFGNHESFAVGLRTVIVHKDPQYVAFEY